VLGYLLVTFRFPLAPLILGVILGDQIEVNLVRALMTDGDPLLFLTRPISGAMLALAVASWPSRSGSTATSGPRPRPSPTPTSDSMGRPTDARWKP
jgi:hypothetical protein